MPTDDEKVLDRYLKVRRMAQDPRTPDGERAAARSAAAKLEEKHPGLREAAEAMEAAAAAAAANPSSSTAPPSWDWAGIQDPARAAEFIRQVRNMPPLPGSPWHERLFKHAFDLFADLALGELDPNTDPQENPAMPRGRRNKKPSYPKDINKFMSNEGVEVALAEDRKTKEPLVEVTFTWPEELFERLNGDKAGAEKLGAYLLREVLTEMGGEEDDEDEDSEDEASEDEDSSDEASEEEEEEKPQRTGRRR